jgi:hypothetical protein
MGTRVFSWDASGGSGQIAGGAPVTIYGYQIRATTAATVTIQLLTGTAIANGDNTFPGYNKPTTSSTDEVGGEVVAVSSTSLSGRGWPEHGVYFPYGIYVKLTGGAPAGTVWFK